MYSFSQLEQINDVVGKVSDGSVVVEVYGDTDTSERKGFGGRIWDTQHWYICSLCSLETPGGAQQIYKVRDALVQPFQQHAQMTNIVSNLFHAELQAAMRFIRVPRDGQVLRAHLAVLETRAEWVVPGGIIS